jgi:hypothetical protein
VSPAPTSRSALTAAPRGHCKGRTRREHRRSRLAPAPIVYRALAEETGGNVDLWYYAWVPQTVDEFNGQFSEAQSLGAKRMLFWEADYIDDRPQAAALKAAMSAKAT